MGADPTDTKIWASCVCRYSCNNCSCWNRTNIKCFRSICTTVVLTNSNLSQCRRTIPNYKCHKLACYQLHHIRDEVVLHQGLGPWTRCLRDICSKPAELMEHLVKLSVGLGPTKDCSHSFADCVLCRSDSPQQIDYCGNYFGDVSSTTVIF